MPGQLMLVRHGQSIWNLENLFTGWIDVDLSAQGCEEARSAGRELARAVVRAGHGLYLGAQACHPHRSG